MPQIPSIAYQPRDRHDDDPMSDYIRVPLRVGDAAAVPQPAGERAV